MKTSPIKTSFSGGEFGPSLFGRTDIAQYQNACEIVENMLCRPYGSVISTPGTQFIREVKDSSKSTRLIPFVFNRADASVIEMGDEYMRFFSSSSAEIGTPLSLDYMEYQTDVLAQAAYVSSDGLAEAQDQSLTDGTGDEYFAYPGRPEMFQIKQAGSTGRLTKFSVEMKKVAGDPGFTLTGKLYALHADGDKPDRTQLLATLSDVDTSTITGTYASITFTIDYNSAPEVVSGTKYAIVVASSGVSGSDYIQINHGGTYANGNWGSGNNTTFTAQSGDVDFKTYVTPVPNLLATSEATLKTQGLKSLKCVALITNSLNDTLTKTFGIPVDLSSASQFRFDIYASRTGSNIKIGIHDAGGTTTEYTPSISTINTWQTFSVDLSAVASANKDAIDSIIITILNADATNTFYIDNMYGLFSEISTPYTEDDIFDVQFAQKNDVLYLTHPDYAPRKLTRYAVDDWRLTTLDFLGGPFMEDNTSAITITPSATAGTISITLSATNSSIFFTPSSGSTAGSVGSYYKIAGMVTSSSTGLSTQGYVKITTCSSSSVAMATVIERLSSSAATTDWAEGSWSAVRGYPARITFFEQRLFFARTNSEPQTIWGSKPFVYDDFAVGAEDDDALNLELSSSEANEIKWLAAGSSLIVGTFGGDFVISSGGTGESLSPTNVVSKGYANWGSEAIAPKRIGNFFYYIQRFGKKLRELFYFWDLDTYKSVDKTIFSPHISGDGFIDLAFQQNPETILWCVRSDGEIATFTREIDQEVQAWSRQVTDGLYESIASIPSSDCSYDEVWVVVNRTIDGETKRYIEVFGDIEPNTWQDIMCYCHSSLTYNAYDYTTGITLTLSATTGSITLTLSATSSSTYFESNDVGQRVRAIDADGVVLGEVEITSVSQSTIAIGTVTTDFDALSYAGEYWGKSVQTISGLNHLEAKEVSALVDGGFENSRQTVSNGSITLQQDYFIAVIGLPFTSTVKTLPIEAGSAKGTAQGKIQRINQIGFKVNRSYQSFYVGGDSDKLERLVYRNATLGESETLKTGVITNKSFHGNYEYGAQILISNTDPLPIEILSIMPELVTEEK